MSRVIRRLLEIYREEIESESPVPLSDDFFEELGSYISGLRELKGAGGLQSEVAGEELNLAKDVAMAIFTLRLCKGVAGLSRGEVDIEVVARLVEEWRNAEAMFKEGGEGKFVEESGIPPSSEVSRGEPGEEMVLIRVVKPLEGTVAAGEQFIYGPFEKDDVVNVPRYLADVLISRGVAKPLDVEEVEDEGSL